MAHMRLGLERFKRATTSEPFAVAPTPTPTQPQPPAPVPAVGMVISGVGIQRGKGASTWPTPDWAKEPQKNVYYLEVIKEGKTVDTLALNSTRIVFGRQAASCDFVLDHPSLSRQHAALVAHKNGGIFVVDLGSAHGTFLSHERLPKDTPTEFETGASLRFGASSRTYMLRKVSFPPPPPPLFPKRPPNQVHLPPPPDPTDSDAVLAHNTLLNRLGIESDSSYKRTDEGRAGKRVKKNPKVGERLSGGSVLESTDEKRAVHFRDEVGGELAAVVGVSDGAHVEMGGSWGGEGGKEGSSLVGKFDSLVRTTIIPRGIKVAGSNELESKGKGDVTDAFKDYLQSLKSPSKGLYGGLVEGDFLRKRERWGGQGEGVSLATATVVGNLEDEKFLGKEEVVGEDESGAHIFEE